LKIYRVAKKEYIDDLSGEGARLYGGRWNKEGDAMLYFSEHLSLCILEILVHLDFKYLDNDYAFIEVTVPDNMVKTFDPKLSLPLWKANPFVSETQDFGSKWLNKKNELALSVPSAVLREERNILINPNHKDFSKLKIVKKQFLDLDSRVVKY
tara:strand:+ start:16463 stop:16921 length:459 start_codon:yes stop_codon:yes gene_type:complete